MDHHCVWVVNCFGAHNYKFFLLFLLYTFLETTLDTSSLLPSFVKFFQEAKHHSISPNKLAITFLAFVLNLAFALSLLCFVIMHASLLSSNTTSIEGTYQVAKWNGTKVSVKMLDKDSYKDPKSMTWSERELLEALLIVERVKRKITVKKSKVKKSKSCRSLMVILEFFHLMLHCIRFLLSDTREDPILSFLELYVT